ncbi:hypothetical protein C2E23DRAFT_886324 [Lenzites betulinus]|nr:hypothetical protein C2E23DRAFT_886324 [Lenzites betulinus]
MRALESFAEWADAASDDVAQGSPPPIPPLSIPAPAREQYVLVASASRLVFTRVHVLPPPVVERRQLTPLHPAFVQKAQRAPQRKPAAPRAAVARRATPADPSNKTCNGGMGANPIEPAFQHMPTPSARSPPGRAASVRQCGGREHGSGGVPASAIAVRASLRRRQRPILRVPSTP